MFSGVLFSAKGYHSRGMIKFGGISCMLGFWMTLGVNLQGRVRVWVG